MPLVERDIQHPAEWTSLSQAIGLIRDGETLRFWLQPRKGKGRGWTCSVEEWKQKTSPAVTEVRNVLTAGTWCCVGLPPSVGLVRELHSPFDQVAKSSEIWPSLLDAELPFALEECSVAFLPPRPCANGGLSCLASAVRVQDQEALLGEWTDLGIEPDAMIPEALLLHTYQPCSIWMGRQRTVCTAGTETTFLAAGGCGQRDRRDKTLSRFQTVWSKQEPPVSWTSVGPEGDGEPEVLERLAAAFLLGKGPQGGNLLSAPLGSDRLTLAFRSRVRRLGLAAMVVVVLFAAGPWWIRLQLKAAQQQVQAEISREYRALTGSTSQAPGQEVLLARRYLEDQRGAWVQAQEEVSGPQLTERFLRVSFTLATLEIPLVRVEAQPNALSALVLTDDAMAEKLSDELKGFGDSVEVSAVDEGVWRVEVKGL